MSQLIKNWSYLLVSDVFKVIISFFVFMFLARKLDPEGYGTFNALLALASLVSVFVINISSNQVIIREVTLYPKTTKNILRLVFPIRIFSLLLAIIALVFYQIYFESNQPGIIIATSVIVVATVIWDLAESIAFGHFVTKFTTVISILASLVWLFVIVLLPAHHLQVKLVALLFAALFFIRAAAYLIVSYKKFVKDNQEKAVVGYSAILLMSMPFLWMRVVGTFGEQVPILLLKGYSGAAEVGYFAVGNRFVMPITLAVTTGLRAVFPFLTKLFKEDKENFKNKIAQAFSFVLITGALIAGVLTGTSYIWVPMFLGDKYQAAIQAFNYQAWFGVLLSFDLILSTVLASTYKQKTLAIITTIDVFIIFPLLYYGSKFGADGMAIAKLVGGLITVAYHIFVVTLVLKININSKLFYLSLVFFVIFMSTSLFVSSSVIKLLILSVTLLIYGSFKTSPMILLINIIRKKITMRNNIRQ